MCEVTSKGKPAKNPEKKTKYNDEQQKEMDCDEPI
jgi:hypothetical protein